MNLQGKIVFSSGFLTNFDIWSLDLASGALSQLTHGENVNDFPRWSPDGKFIAYVSVEQDLIASLWVMAADGSSKKRLTKDVHCQSPSWSPDGKHLIFTANAPDKNEIEVCSIAAQGGAPSRVFVHRGVEETPSYSPDGKRIIFSAPAPNGGSRDTDIVEYDIASGGFRVICSHPAKDYGPLYSPDGTRIAFISHRNGISADIYREAYENYREILTNGSNADAREAVNLMRKFEQDGDIFVAAADGSDLAQLTHDSAADNGVCWSPCGNYLLYTSAPASAQDTERLRIIDVRTGKRVPFSYDRTALEREIESRQALNTSFLTRAIPDFIERSFVDGSFWGEERHPHWIS